MDMEIITKDTNTFDNLSNRPVRPTDADISNAMTPLPPLVRNGFFVGQVITMSGNQAPQGTLVCDGTVYNIEDYPDLANYYEASQGSKNFYGGDGETTFAVPDYQGEFLRGTGTNSHTNQGSGANVGVHQDSSYLLYGWANNQYAGRYFPTSPSSGYQSSTGNIDNRFVVGKRASVQSANPLTAPSSTTNDIYADNFRPTNTSVLFCVVY